MKKRKSIALKKAKSKKSYSSNSKVMDLIIGAALGNVTARFASKAKFVKEIPYSGILVPIALAYGATIAKIPYGDGMAIGASVEAVNEGIKAFAPDVHAKFLAGQEEFVISGQPSVSDPLAGAQFLLGESERMENLTEENDFVMSGSTYDPLA